MPLIFVPIDAQLGACLQVRLGSQLVKALIDPGAERTTIDKAVAQMLELKPLRNAELSTPSGKTDTVVYEYPVTLIHPDMNMTIDALQVIEGDFAGQDLDLILGRDVLSRCILVWNGPLQAATITF